MFFAFLRSELNRRDRDDSRERDRGYDRREEFDRDRGRYRDAGGADRDFERHRSRDRDHGRHRDHSRYPRDDSRDYGNGNSSRGSFSDAGNFSQRDTFQGNDQGRRQPRFEQEYHEGGNIEMELQRQRIMSQIQFFNQARQQSGGGMGMMNPTMGGQHPGHRGRRY